MKTPLSKKLALLFISIIFLSACGERNESASSAEESSQEQPTDELSGQLSTIYYPAVIKDGQYALSNSRGLGVNTSSQSNLRNLETGLYSLAQSVFPTDQYAFKEGSVISEDQLNEWLSANNSEDAPEGLNPANSSGAASAEEFEPAYLNSILEYNFTQENDQGNQQLQGISIALAMNSMDTYENTEENIEQEFPIDQETALAKGQEMASTIVERIRSNEDQDYSEIPIQVAVFYNAPEDDLGGGVYLGESISNSGNEMSEWISHNRDYVAFGVDEVPDGDDEAAFTRFRTSVQDFFPRLSGLSGVGLYENDQLTRMDITINSQFDSYTGIIALTQHTIEEANNIFRSDVPINITINAPSGTVAVINRQAGNSTFDYVIL